MTPGPYELSQKIADNIYGGIKGGQQASALDQILQEAANSDDPKNIDKVIAQVASRVAPEKQQMAMEILNAKKADLIDRQLGAPEGIGSASTVVQNDWLQSRKPVKSAGGISAQEVPPAIAEKIQEVVNNNPEASAEELTLAFDNKGIPRAYSNSYIEDRRRKDKSTGEASSAAAQQTRAEQLLFHKETKDYDDKLIDNASKAESQLETAEAIFKAVKSGNVKPSSIANILELFGAPGKAIANAMLNQDQATLIASIPYLLEGWKDIFGIRLTDADLALLEGKLPSIGKSASANKAIIAVIQKYSRQAILKNEVAKKIKKENGGLRPLNYNSLVEERFAESIKTVRVVNPQTGKVIRIPANDLPAALQEGATLADG